MGAHLDCYMDPRSPSVFTAHCLSGCRGVLFDIPLQHQVWDGASRLAQPLSGLKLQADPQLPWEVLERRIHQLCDPWKQNTSCFSSWSCVALHV